MIDDKQIKDNKIFVGFSGGADSTALLLLLDEKYHDHLTAVHFHHGIRKDDANKDLKHCKEFCAVRKIPFLSYHLNIPQNKKTGESVEQAARRLRLQKWKKILPEDGLVALAHNSDDVLENYFLRLARGSNATGLCGLRKNAQICAVRIIRPLLETSRAEIEHFLNSKNISWRTDKSNFDTIYKRNAVRHQLIPLLKEIFGNTTGIYKSIKNLTLDADYIQQEAEKLLKGLNSLEKWKAIHPALMPRVLCLWYTKETGDYYSFTGDTIKRILKELKKDINGHIKITVSDNMTLLLDPNGLSIFNKKIPLLPSPIKWNWKQSSKLKINSKLTLKAYLTKKRPTISELRTPQSCWLDTAWIPETLTVRTRKNGDKMTCFGNITKKIKNIFIEKKIPITKRDSVPLILDDKNILWLTGIQRSNNAIVTKKTTEFLLIQFDE
ncbi:MAG: tRNA lysidine(34) synthetase TilS [Verrucomicrobiota bacterium]|nr:tRNA lysidine(34) synthetase TilS [Verrucomicrobiota bacterium]